MHGGPPRIRFYGQYRRALDSCDAYLLGSEARADLRIASTRFTIASGNIPTFECQPSLSGVRAATDAHGPCCSFHRFLCSSPDIGCSKLVTRDIKDPVLGELVRDLVLARYFRVWGPCSKQNTNPKFIRDRHQCIGKQGDRSLFSSVAWGSC